MNKDEFNFILIKGFKMTCDEIEKLITLPKKIIEISSKDLKEENKHFRQDLRLQSLESNDYFRMFTRKHKDFPEDFSIGLDLLPNTPLLRCNGPHDVTKDTLKPNPHYGYHIHKLSEEGLEKDLKKLSLSEITTAFSSYNEALRYFIKITNIINAEDYFNIEPTLFDQQ